MSRDVHDNPRKGKEQQNDFVGSKEGTIFFSGFLVCLHRYKRHVLSSEPVFLQTSLKEFVTEWHRGFAYLEKGVRKGLTRSLVPL